MQHTKKINIYIYIKKKTQTETTTILMLEGIRILQRERKRPPRMERVTKIRALREKGDRWITMCGKLILIWDTICMGGR